MIPPARLLQPHENLGSRIHELLDRDSIVNCFLYSRLAPLFDQAFRFGQSMKSVVGGDVWVHEEDGEIASLCYVGANLVPSPSEPRAIEAFAKRARRVGRYSSSIVGPKECVLNFWEQMSDAWGPARGIREHQPLLSIDQIPLVACDSRVRRVEPIEIAELLPASVAMFTEELGISPIGTDGIAVYRAKLAEQIASGFVFALFENGEVIFKCELGATSPSVCQIQGVWTKPDRRGAGIGTAGLARVVEFALELAPTVCLYVNDFNIAARRSYEKIGFREVGAFASVLF
jgi:predicted GNAT family acetyltransferase